MAQPIYCDSGDGEPAAFLVTNLETGDCLQPCLAHAGSVFWSLAQAFAAVPDQEPAGSQESDGSGPGEGEAAPSTPRPKRRRARRQAASEALASEASPFEDPTPVES